MATFDHLVGLFEGGHLGNLIATSFYGERGHVNANEDSDLLVIFQDESALPSVAELSQKIREHYIALGYGAKEVRSPQNTSLEMRISPKDSPHTLVLIVITTHYPHNGSCANLRITSTIFD